VLLLLLLLLARSMRPRAGQDQAPGRAGRSSGSSKQGTVPCCCWWWWCSTPHLLPTDLCPQLLLPRQNHVQQKKPLTAAALQSAIDNIRGAVMICYPQGLPEWDMVRQCLEEREDLSGTNVSRESPWLRSGGPGFAPNLAAACPLQP
jgi:hypothetical protein